MSDAPAPGTTLDFDTPAAPATACAFCASPIVDQYFTVNGQVTCARCVVPVRAHGATGAGLAGVARAIGIGSAAGLAGAAVWWAIRRFASLEIGLIAIGIGHFVGLGVRQGSGGRGGRGFQVLAVALTYFWITANYVPDIVQAVMARDGVEAVGEVSGGGAPAAAAPVSARETVLAVAFVLGIAVAAPFLEGAGNIIGLLIISFGLWQAWKLNAATPIVIEGPFRLQAAAPTAASLPPPLPPPVPGA